MDTYDWNADYWRQTMITASIDGLAEPRNPGTGTYGYVIYEGERKLAEGEGLAGYEVTNNYAEYTALVEALRRIKELRIEGEVVIRSDSLLLVGQMSKGWEVKKGGYLEKFKEAKDLLKEFGSVKFEWIPRKQNEEADLLSRIAYEKHRKK
jgi:ribonuclease HI